MREKPKIISRAALLVAAIPLSKNNNIDKAKNNSAICCLANASISVKKIKKDIKKTTAKKAILSSVCLRNT